MVETGVVGEYDGVEVVVEEMGPGGSYYVSVRNYNFSSSSNYEIVEEKHVEGEGSAEGLVEEFLSEYVERD